MNGRLAAADLVAASRRLGPVMPNLSLVPATFELGRQENRLLIRHLLQPGETDPRFALVRLLSSDAVLAAFKLVIIDTPPRPTIGTIAALCASTHAIIPTILDKGSTDNVGGVIAMMDRLFRKDLNPHIKFAGIVGTKTQAQRLDATERRSRFDAERVAQARWGSRAGGIEAIAVLEEWPDDGYVLQKNVPDTARFHADAGHTIAYLDERQPNAVTRAHIAELGRQIARRIGL